MLPFFEFFAKADYSQAFTYTGGKVRAFLTLTRFLDVHFDPTTNSYSYALVDLTISLPGDKRQFGWDDYPHPDRAALTSLVVV
jgi:hypothetical protein